MGAYVVVININGYPVIGFQPELYGALPVFGALPLECCLTWMLIPPSPLSLQNHFISWFFSQPFYGLFVHSDTSIPPF